MNKISLTMAENFSGIGCQKESIDNTGLFDLKVVSTSDIDKDAIVSYAAIHCGLTQELIDSYEEYPSREQMAEDLIRLNIGYDPAKNKIYDWNKVARKKSNDIEKVWLACKLANNLGDISKIDKLPIADLWTISSPCFVEGTLVLTENGYKEIQDIEVGETVLTHTGKWQKVLKTMTNEAEELRVIKTMPSELIHCTPNHPFYVRKKHNEQDSSTGKRWRTFDKPEWIQAKDLTTDYYVGTPINTIEEIPVWEGIQMGSIYAPYISNKLSGLMDNEDFWYIIGRFIGDGYTDKYHGGIRICANDQEVGQITERLDRLGFSYGITEKRTCNLIRIGFNEIGEFCRQFGHGAANKHLTKMVMNLPIHTLKSFVEGYIDSDGCFTEGVFKVTTVSRHLVYDMAQCIEKVYHRPVSVYFVKRESTKIIEGRLVNQRDSYTITFKTLNNVQDKAFYEDGYIWSPIRDNNSVEYDGLVYNLEVENDNSYVVQNVIVHNCQDISVAGKMRGLNPDDSTRSSLLWSNVKLLKEAHERGEAPKFLLFENVKNLVGKAFKKDFDTLCDILRDELGYNCYYTVLNAAECGVPQHRERVFLIGIRQDIDNGKFTFPVPFDNGLRLKDVLQPKEEIDEKYYVTNPRALDLIKELFTKGVIKSLKARIRKLTPTECFVLQGMKKEYIGKCKNVGISDSALYKQAGNGIATPCVKLIFEHLYKALYDENYVCEDETFEGIEFLDI